MHGEGFSWLSGNNDETVEEVLTQLETPFSFDEGIATCLKSEEDLSFDSQLSASQSFASSADNQIYYYGKLIKQVTMEPMEEQLVFDEEGRSTDNPVLFGVSDEENYVDFVARTSRRTSGDHGGGRNVYYLSLEMNIVQDNRWGWDNVLGGGEIVNLLGGDETISVCWKIATIQSD